MSAGLMNVGRSALMAAYAQLQTTGHNIANAATPGYSRQEVVVASAGADFSGAGYIGRGVDVADVRRRYDRFVDAEVAAGTAASSADGARAAQASRIEKLFSDPATGVGAAFDDLNLAMADVVNRPADAGARGVVLARADALASRLRGLDASLAEVGASIEGRIGQGVRTANDTLSRLASVNQQIAQSGGSTSQPNDLLDQRDALVVELNKSLKATATFAPDGTASVFAAGGQALVVGSRAAQLVTTPDPLDATRARVALKADAGAAIPMDASALGGGELAGLLRARDDDLSAVRGRVGQLAVAIAAAYNDQQRAGVDLNGAAGADLFATGRPSVASATTNQGGATFSVAVTDAAKVQPSDYRLAFDGTAFQVTRLADGAQVASFAPPAPGATVSLPTQGLQLKLDAGSAAAGDRFEIRAASAFAGGMQRTLAAPAGLAAALSMAPQPGAANAGTLRVASFSAAASGAAPMKLQFTGPGTFDAPGATPPVTGATYTPGQPIQMGGWSMTLTGTPAAGDTIAVAANASPSTDNRNARAMADLSTRALAAGATIGEAYAATIADAGTRSQAAQAAQTMSDGLLTRATAARAEVAGVNLDEEAARLMQYQQAYQAAAKVLQTAQSMFDSLLQATR